MKQVMIGVGKGVEIKVGGVTHTLLFNGYAMFALQEEYGTNFVPEIEKCDEKEFEKICRIAEILSEQGELARRKLGFSPCEIKEINSRGVAILFDDAAALIEAVITAFNIGFQGEIKDENEEIDLILTEMRKNERVKLSEYIRIGIVSGLRMDETLEANVGLVNDLCELHNRTNRKEEQNG